MVDLGKYATAVLSSYAASLALLLLIVVVSYVQWRKARTALESLEDKARGSHE